MKLRKLLFSIVFAFSFLLIPFHETTSAQAKICMFILLMSDKETQFT